MNAPPTELPLEIIWPRLIAIADEMATTLFRTAFSHDVIEVHDMSTGLCDARGNLIAQTWLGATGHTGVMPVFGKNLMAAFPPETIRPGDVFICNDPWLCNGQTADVFIATPAFLDERFIGFSVNSVHHVDIGGRKGSGLAEEVYEEGLIIPMLRLYAEGRANQDLFQLLRRNVRFSEMMIGDIRAQVSAGWIGAGAMEALAREFRLPSLLPVADEIIRRTEAGMRRGIASLPDGRHRRETTLEIEGLDERPTIALELAIEGDEIAVDLAGTSRQVRRPVNCPMNYTRAYVAVPMKMVCDPELPNNEGTYLPMRIQAPEGCLLNPTYPAACFWRLAAGMLVSDLMFRILADIAPDRAPAESGSLPTWQFYVNGVRRNGELFALHQHALGGMGGRPGRDGLASISFPYNVRDVSIEWSEVETPVLFERRELIADSGGPGRWRGGLGEELVPAGHGDVDAAVPLILSGSAGRMAAGPLGLFGGGAGGLGRISVDGEPIPTTSSPNVAFHSGQRLSLRCPGGGGHGKPGERPAAAILADLADGYVTPVGAKRDYGYPRGEATEEDETP